MTSRAHLERMEEWHSRWIEVWFLHWPNGLVFAICQNHQGMCWKDGISQSFLGIGFAVKVECVPASVAVAWRLLLRPAISNLSAPSCSRVQFDDGTSLTPAWSQLMTNWDGMLCASSVRADADRSQEQEVIGVVTNSFRNVMMYGRICGVQCLEQ